VWPVCPAAEQPTPHFTFPVLSTFSAILLGLGSNRNALRAGVYDPDVFLTDEQVATYHREGYVVLGVVADTQGVAALLEAEARFRPCPDQAFATSGAESKLLVRDQLSNQSEAVRRFVTEGPHLEPVVQVLGPNVAFTHTQFITKLPDDGDVHSFIPLHQDDGYGTLDPPLDVTVWTALTDTDEHNGCLVVVPRSHLDGVLDHGRAANNPALRAVEATGAIPIPLAAGEAVLFSGLTLHGSGPNRSPQHRVGMHARYCHPGVRMVTMDDRPVLDDPHSWMVRGEAPADAWASANHLFTES